MLAYYVHTAAYFLAGLGSGVLLTLGAYAVIRWQHPDSTQPTLILPPDR